MKIKLYFHRLSENIKHRVLIERELLPLAHEIPFDEAKVMIRRPSADSSQIETSIHLVLPGPDLRLTATDYTVAAAWLKLRRLIRDTWQLRLRKRKRKLADHGPRPAYARAHS